MQPTEEWAAVPNRASHNPMVRWLTAARFREVWKEPEVRSADGVLHEQPTLVLADTPQQAAYWGAYLGITRPKYVYSLDAILGCDREFVEVVAVGPLRDSYSVHRYHEFFRCGFRVTRVLETELM